MLFTCLKIIFCLRHKKCQTNFVSTSFGSKHADNIDKLFKCHVGNLTAKIIFINQH